MSSGFDYSLLFFTIFLLIAIIYGAKYIPRIVKNYKNNRKELILDSRKKYSALTFKMQEFRAKKADLAEQFNNINEAINVDKNIASLTWQKKDKQIAKKLQLKQEYTRYMKEIIDKQVNNFIKSLQANESYDKNIDICIDAINKNNS